MNEEQRRYYDKSVRTAVTNQWNPFYVVQYTLDNKFVTTISGLGRNKNTLDSSHSKRTAQKYARLLQKKDRKHIYKVEGNTYESF